MKAPHPSSKSIPKQEPETSQYTWDTVSTWKYANNVCFLYDEQGRLLDTLQLDLIVEEYVERVTESRQKHPLSAPKTTMVKMTEKDHELLQMIRRRDTDVDSAVSLLHISRQKFDTIVQKLLQLEMLQYLSDTEVKLTEKGLQYLSDLHKK
jgi:RNase adaptor protein for sRNA GlmZ degradation